MADEEESKPEDLNSDRHHEVCHASYMIMHMWNNFIEETLVSRYHAELGPLAAEIGQKLFDFHQAAAKACMAKEDEERGTVQDVPPSKVPG